MATTYGLRRSFHDLSESACREPFGTEKTYRKALFEIRWRYGVTCPACGHRVFCALKTLRNSGATAPSSRLRLTSSTVVQDIKLPLTVGFTAIDHLAPSKVRINSIELSRRLARSSRLPGGEAQADASYG